jgi:alkyl sulfatase BDS1-like metallo-beta-lactamase superfamily hydrolase
MQLRQQFFIYIMFLASTAIYAEEHNLSIKNVSGKPATPQTLKSNQAFANTLNFKDVRAFENNDKGLVAEFDQATGDIIRNSFQFIKMDSADKAPSTVNPSLWRQAVLNQKAEGLYDLFPFSC